MNIDEINKYLLTPKKMDFDDSVLKSLALIKGHAKENNDEELANICWLLESVFKIQFNFVKAFKLLEDEKYEEAWNLYEKIEISLSNVNRHFDYSKNEYELLFIATQTFYFQRLFPYKHFTSREMTIGKQICSICGNEITSPRNACEHVVGDIYMGEMCRRILEDIEFIALALTTCPLDKYAIVKPKDYEFDYSAIEMLLERNKSPYGLWKLSEVREKDKKFCVGRNDKCPCGSGKKYKKCCFGTDKELKTRERIDICEGKPFIETPVKEIGTWKKQKKTKDGEGFEATTQILQLTAKDFN